MITVATASVELHPAASLGAAPVLASLAPFVLDGLSVSRSEESEFGLFVWGPSELVADAAAAVSARFGPAVLVDPVVDLPGA